MSRAKGNQNDKVAEDECHATALDIRGDQSGRPMKSKANSTQRSEMRSLCIKFPPRFCLGENWLDFPPTKTWGQIGQIRDEAENRFSPFEKKPAPAIPFFSEGNGNGIGITTSREKELEWNHLFLPGQNKRNWNGIKKESKRFLGQLLPSTQMHFFVT